MEKKTVALICLEITKVWGTSGWQKLFKFVFSFGLRPLHCIGKIHDLVILAAYLMNFGDHLRRNGTI